MHDSGQNPMAARGLSRTMAHFWMILGVIIVLSSLTKLPPAFLALAWAEQGTAHVFFGSFLASGLVGLLLWAPVRHVNYDLRLRDGFLIVTLTWVFASLVSALPFVHGPPNLSYTDAIFEATSGLTTTGATVIVGLDDLPRSVQFYRQLLVGLNLADDEEFLRGHADTAAWPALRARLAAVFATRTRDEWAAQFHDSDACVAPVLAIDEVRTHPHNAERGAIIELGGVAQPAPAPRFSRTVPQLSTPPPTPGHDTRRALLGWGLAAEEVDSLVRSGPRPRSVMWLEAMSSWAWRR